MVARHLVSNIYKYLFPPGLPSSLGSMQPVNDEAQEPLQAMRVTMHKCRIWRETDQDASASPDGNSFCAHEVGKLNLRLTYFGRGPQIFLTKWPAASEWLQAL